MGFNISGIVVNKNFDKDIKKFAEAMGLNIAYQKEVTFETASANWTEEPNCFVHFTDQATIAFMPMEKASEPFQLRDATVLTFIYSAVSMTFKIDYFEGFESKRSHIESDGETFMSEGKLPEDEQAEDTSDLVFMLMNKVLGKDWHSIELDEISHHCNFQ